MNSYSNLPIVRAAIGMGSNLGDSIEILRSAIVSLAATEGIVIERVSSVYRTKAVGPPQPDYLNAATIVATELTAIDLLRRMQTIELTYGRVRSERFGARTLDLDLLLYGEETICLTAAESEDLDLVVPHPRMRDREFVLAPLAEIAAEWREPLYGLTILALRQKVSDGGITRLSDSLTRSKTTPKL